MSKELTGVTNGTYILEETNVENQFYFFRKDHGVLDNVGTIPIEMFARYLIHKVKEEEINDEYAGEISFELSTDKKVLRLIATEHTKPNLHIVKSEESQVPDVPEATKPRVDISKLAFWKWFVK